MPVIAIRKHAKAAEQPPAPRTKTVEGSQKAIDALPLNSGAWRIAGVPGLYVRSRRTSKSFYVQRRVRGELVRENLGALSMKDAKEKAMAKWGGMRRPPGHATFAQAFSGYIEQRTLAAATVKNYRVSFDTYLEDWHTRSLREIGEGREALRDLQHRIRKHHGAAKANQVVRLIRAVYNWQRDGADETLPEFPRKAVPLDSLAARDWAYDDEQLQTWWHAIEETKDGNRIERGVKTLGPIKRAYWLTSLFTGARPRSVENLKWADVDLEKRTIHFRVTKGDRPYTVPLSEALERVLTAYRDSGDVPPSEWIFPGKKEGAHLVDVKNEKQGVGAKYHLRHTFRTALAGLGFTPDQAKLLMGHSLGGDVSSGYISAPLLVESLRPVANAIAEHYLKVIPEAAPSALRPRPPARATRGSRQIATVAGLSREM
jgi:integrase